MNLCSKVGFDFGELHGQNECIMDISMVFVLYSVWEGQAIQPTKGCLLILVQVCIVFQVSTEPMQGSRWFHDSL